MWLLCGSLTANFGLTQVNKFLHTLGQKKDRANKFFLQRFVVLLEAGSAFALLSLPLLASEEYDILARGYDWVIVCGAVVVFQALLSLYDPAMHQMGGRFHEHAHAE